MARDLYHNNVREALQKDGWAITHDPYTVRIEEVGYEIDFGAEPLIAAEKGESQIAVEVKSFVGPSTVNEFHKAIGQFNDYSVALEIREPERALFLAIPEDIWLRFFQKQLIQRSLQRVGARIFGLRPKLKHHHQMDKVKNYQDAIVEFLHFYNAETGGNRPNESVKRRVLIDRENNSFQLLAIGWNGSHYIFSPIFHFDIIEGKVWMQCNNTEWEAVDFLMEHGVAREDIVLGFVAPQARAFSGFAVA